MKLFGGFRTRQEQLDAMEKEAMGGGATPKPAPKPKPKPIGLQRQPVYAPKEPKRPKLMKIPKRKRPVVPKHLSIKELEARIKALDEQIKKGR